MLCLAAGFGHVDCTKILIEAGANREAKDIRDATPLLAAACMGRLGCLDALIAAGVDIEAKSKNRKYTALAWAALDGHDACVARLIEAGADIETKTFPYDGQLRTISATPIWLAARMGNEACVAKLIEAGAEVRPITFELTIPADNVGPGVVECLKRMTEKLRDENRCLRLLREQLAAEKAQADADAAKKIQIALDQRYAAGLATGGFLVGYAFLCMIVLRARS